MNDVETWSKIKKQLARIGEYRQRKGEVMMLQKLSMVATAMIML